MEKDLDPIVPDLGLPELPPSRSGRRRRLVSLVSAGAVLAVTVGAVALLAGGGKPSPERELKALRGFLAERDTAHFVMKSTNDDGEDTYESSARGDLVLPGFGHWRAEGDGAEVETISTPEGNWYRSDHDYDEETPDQWVYFPPRDRTESGGGFFGYAPGEEMYAGNPSLPWGRDHGLAGLLARIKSPERVAPNVIRARLTLLDLVSPLPKGFDESLLPEGEATIELTSGPGGRLDRMVVRIASDEWSTDKYETEGDHFDETDRPGVTAESAVRTVDTTEITFSRWDEPVRLTPPPAAAVDPTPDVDEEDLAAFNAFKVLVPRHLPAGMHLESAEVYSHGDDESCPTISLTWSKDFEPTGTFVLPDHVDLEAVQLCEAGEPHDATDEEPFAAGPYHGTFYDYSEDEDDDMDFSPLRSVTLQIEGVEYTFDSNLTKAQMSEILSDLVPLDLATQPLRRNAPPAD